MLLTDMNPPPPPPQKKKKKKGNNAVCKVLNETFPKRCGIFPFPPILKISQKAVHLFFRNFAKNRQTIQRADAQI